MTAPTRQQPLPDLEALVRQLRGDLFQRWMTRAQKGALLEWRDREQTPGLAARMTAPGEKYYRWGDRAPRYYAQKIPGYVRNFSAPVREYFKTGALRQRLLARRPKAIRGGDVVRTRLAYGGLSLNFMDGPSYRPVQQVVRLVERVSITVREHAVAAHQRSVRTRSGLRRVMVAGYQVGAHRVDRIVGRSQLVRGGEPYGRAWGAAFKQLDAPWIQTRVAELFRAIVSKAALDRRGRVRSAVLEKLDEGTAA